MPEHDPSFGEGGAFDASKQLLTTAVGDIKGSIHANDQKVSAALVVNGLLMTSVVTVATRSEHVYKKASDLERGIGVGLLGVALLAFLVSVGWLLWAMKPYRPEKLEEGLAGKYPRVFFPTEKDLKIEAPALFAGWRERVDALEPASILDELTVEILKLADILKTESNRAKWGYVSLAVEGVVVTAFFVLVAITAIGR